MSEHNCPIRLLEKEIEIEQLKQELMRLQVELKRRDDEDRAVDIDIERILKHLPPLTPGPASIALSKMRQALGMESGPIGDVVVRGAEEIERLGRCNEELSRSHAEVINHQNAEIKQLRCERDEARKATLWCANHMRDPEDCIEAINRWPWLEEEK